VTEGNPYFSIVIPTYNRAGYIAKAIQSLIDQDFDSFEVIIVDDGGTDNTQDIVSRFQDARIRFFKKENGERAAARNFGAAKANGKFISFLDSDDYVRKQFLQNARSVVEINPGVTVFHIGYDIVAENGRVLKKWKALPSPVNHKLIEGNFLSCLGVFVRRDVLEKNRFNEDRNLSGSEDYELWMRLAARFEIITNKMASACLVNHDSRSVVNITEQNLLGRLDLLRKYLFADHDFMVGFKDRVHQFDAFLDLYAALHLTMHGNHNAGRKLLKSAVRKYRYIVFNYRYWVVVRKLLVGR
jgi:glycosyltransferase involved in cell wall biosynthesis